MQKETIVTVPEFEEVGEIAADEMTPSFEQFRFKAYHDKSAPPGTMVAVKITSNRFLLGRVSASHEHNPHFSAEQLSVQHALEVKPDHPGEELSFTIFRLYEVDVIDEIHIVDNKPIVRPSETMPKAGSKVIIPPQSFIYALLGLAVRKVL
jgi:hypothetical protein